MKILLINHYAGSVYHGMEFRPYYLSREWVKMGHEVTIVAASYSHLRQQNIEMADPIKEEYIDGIRYVWLKTPEYHGNGVGRIKNMLTFLRKLYHYLPSITKNFVPDAVIASSTYPLDSYPANWIAKKHGAKFVFELHDLWPLSPMVLGNISKWHPYIMVMQMGEDYWCKNADLIVSLLPDAYKHLVTRGMPLNKYIVIPNGVNDEEWDTNKRVPLPEEHKKCIEILHNKNKFIVGFVGGLELNNGLFFLLKIAQNLEVNDNIHILLVGKGNERDNITCKINEHQIHNITVLPPVSKKAIPNLLESLDVLTLGSENNILGQYGVSPNKLFDYMMSAKPIIWNLSTSCNIITLAKCGITVYSDNENQFITKLKLLRNMSFEERKIMGLNGRKYVLNNYTYNILAYKFINAINTLDDK